MKWIKQGRIITLEDIKIDWMQSHTQIPVPYVKQDGIIRIYFNSRTEGKSRPTFVDINGQNMKIVNVNKKPLLEIGKPGTFDDSGVMISSIIEHDEKIYMYYIGWNQGVTVSYQNSIGLAVSEDGGTSFKKYSEGPIVGRSMSDPIFVASPYVIKSKDRWILYYLSCTQWVKGKSKMEPVYHIKYALSNDGIKWETGLNNICIDGIDEAIATPCVIKAKDKYLMWYSTRKTLDYRNNRENSYKIGYAESQDGVSWIRKDSEVGIDVSDTGWDSEMIEYAHVIKQDDRYIMFYNGNGFGQSGIGYAICNPGESK